MSISPANGVRALVILVVEDEFLVRCSVAEGLRDAGYAVVEATSGEEAVTFSKSEMAIDIVFTDINLTGPTNGWDVAECFRTDRPNIPVLYASGKSFDTQRRVPGSVFVPKPYTNPAIVEAIGKLDPRLGMNANEIYRAIKRTFAALYSVRPDEVAVTWARDRESIIVRCSGKTFIHKAIDDDSTLEFVCNHEEPVTIRLNDEERHRLGRHLHRLNGSE